MVPVQVSLLTTRVLVGGRAQDPQSAVAGRHPGRGWLRAPGAGLVPCPLGRCGDPWVPPAAREQSVPTLGLSRSTGTPARLPMAEEAGR